MRELYSQLLNGNGSREVTAKDVSVTSELVGKLLSVKVKSVYVFRGSTNIRKETQNLTTRTMNVVKLDKIEITRITNMKNVSISLRFLSNDDVLIFNESDIQLLTMSDHALLGRIGIEVV